MNTYTHLKQLTAEFHSLYNYILEKTEGTKDHWKVTSEWERDKGGDCEDGALQTAVRLGPIEDGYKLYLCICDVQLKKLERHACLILKTPRGTWRIADWTNGFFGFPEHVPFYHLLEIYPWDAEGMRFAEVGEKWVG